uniref:C3H1-type domain-containing protein n=1 Tax=Ananas comosus var. bracteatus TaxID=296719 RepID=A0A6V7Q2J4_ANACO|nr:unnamed protein product [Ananas comosus var. bracteatus]
MSPKGLYSPHLSLLTFPCLEKSPSMAEPLTEDFAELRLSDEMSAPDLDSGAGGKDGAGFLSFMKGLLGNVVKLSSPTSPMPAAPLEPDQASKEETRETLPSRVIETECKKATKEKQNETAEQKETENEKVEKKEIENEKPAQEKGKEATAQSGGQKECKFYSMPGGCKYGGSCRFAHHLGKSDVDSVELNFLGLPIRPGKRECPFYMRTGNCKFSTNCKFHHPDPIADSARDATYGYSNGEAQKQNSSGASQMPTTPWPEPRTMNEPILSMMHRHPTYQD